MVDLIPVVLFAYARPDHLHRTLACLKENDVPLIYAYSDGARTQEKASAVEEVRSILRAVDWCEVVVTEREDNLGLGRSVRSGVSEVFEKHEALIVFEDDLICVPGTYQYLCAALEQYRDTPQVMSVSGWTHPRAIPSDVTTNPYFDGRAECWSWGAWKRSWVGMERNARSMIAECLAKGINVYRYGADLYEMALQEEKHNLWAVRWSYHHILNGGLCLRPPRSMVENIGFGDGATNTQVDMGWSNLPLLPAPPIPQTWPEAVEHPDCPAHWQAIYGTHTSAYTRFQRRVINKIKSQLSKYR